MYVVTFYSFKGGVGRTMSLVNVATQLALSGKRVLIVDFDLEAPGIPTFSLTAPKKEQKGIIEYISDYRKSGNSPAIEDYVYSAHQFNSKGEILVMPAGLHDNSYSTRLNAIDWSSLYAREDGYFFLEDMKYQWQQCFNPDYVFIDSRTGHSDVEGICTRQLPDAVCLLFFPNDQNLQGLKKVVNNIQNQNTKLKGQRDPIALHFVVSNVPDLDDEDGIIGNTLNRFSAELGYSELAGQIHHYNSLSLLNQEIFSEKRPNSRLAREYRALADTIASENISDRDVAIQYLRQRVRDFRSRGIRTAISATIERVERIAGIFPNDSEVIFEIALIYEAIGRFSDAYTLLAGDGTHKSAHLLAIRARLGLRLGKQDEAIKDLYEMLEATEAEVPSLLEALSFAGQLDSKVLEALPASKAMSSLDAKDRLFVALQLQDTPEALLAKASILESLTLGADVSELEIVKHHLALVSIGLGRFTRAIDLLGPIPLALDSNDIGRVFNLAMAKLGIEKTPDTELFGRTVELDQKHRTRDADANYLACMAIANAAINRKDAALMFLNESRAKMKATPQREFSPWTYTRVASREFMRHLDYLESQINEGILKPAYYELQL